MLGLIIKIFSDIFPLTGNPITFIDPKGLSHQFRNTSERKCYSLVDADGEHIPGSERCTGGGGSTGSAVGGGFGSNGLGSIGSSAPGFSPNGGGDWTQYAGLLSGPHSYDIPPIKTSCTADQLFEAWRQPGNSAPTNEYATAGTRTVVLLGNNPITQTVNVQNRTILNRTQASHAFHSGTVLISITSTANGGSQSIVTGRGDGAVPWFNDMVGAFLFRPAQQRASIDCAEF